MTRLEWGSRRDRIVKYGVEHGVFYPKNSPGVVWNGLISINETPESSDVAVGYYDGVAYYRERGAEGFAAQIQCFTYPDSIFATEPFGLSYKTSGELHLVYQGLATSDARVYSSIKASIDPTIHVWNLVTTPVKIPGFKATSHLIIDLTRTAPGIAEVLEDLLYGTESTDPRLPPFEELLEIFETYAIFKIVDNGDGTWTAFGPEDWIDTYVDGSFEITSPSAIYISPTTYKISSW